MTTAQIPGPQYPGRLPHFGWFETFKDITYTACRICRKVKLADDQKHKHGGVCSSCRGA